MSVRTAMAQSKGASFTIQLGHLLDRAALSALSKRGKTLPDSMPLSFWFTILAMAVSSTPDKRIAVLFESLLDNNDPRISMESVTEVVGYLQDTCQLVPDTQIVTTTHKYPIQEYGVASPLQLVDRQQTLENMQVKDVDLQGFTDILCSKSVCAWGECYKKRNK